MSIVERTISKLQGGAQPVSGKLPSSLPPRIGPISSSPGAGLAPRPGQRSVKLDRSILREAGLLPPEADETRLAIEYRHVKRPLIRAARDLEAKDPDRAPFIMIASAIPGEGKTFTAVNLALSLSLEKDLRVLLVDGDVAKGHISELFELGAEPGLLDVLTDLDTHPESVVVSTDVAGLSILPRGTRQAGATELLASDRMRQVLHSLAATDPARLIILDSPPLLLTTESRALASLVGQIVVVVKAGSTARHVVEQALDALEGHENISLILNQYAGALEHGYYEYGIKTGA